VSSPNTTIGDRRLWLKGGAGSMAIINLFNGADTYGYDDDCNAETEDDINIPNEMCPTPNGIPDELDEMRHEKWLINDASLTFYVAGEQQTEKPAYRIYLYDLKNKRPLADHAYDVSTVTGSPQLNKFVHGGIYVPGKTRYTVRLTNHIRNLVNQGVDSTNVQLGLVVTESINYTYNMRLKTPPNTTIDRVPAASVVSQRGVVLYGTDNQDGSIPAGNPSNPDDPENPNKQLRLKIYYTKQEEN